MILLYASSIIAALYPATGVHGMLVSCAAQTLSQRGIVHASGDDYATNAHGDESKRTLASPGAV